MMGRSDRLIRSDHEMHLSAGLRTLRNVVQENLPPHWTFHVDQFSDESWSVTCVPPMDIERGFAWGVELPWTQVNCKTETEALVAIIGKLALLGVWGTGYNKYPLPQCDQYQYKPHYACFKCRQSFKRLAAEKCPECGGPVISMGRRWRSPKRNNKKAWKDAENNRRPGY